MTIKSIIKQFDIKAQCKKYGLGLWQCPQFLFLMMGIIIVSSTVSAYFVGSRYINDPLTVVLIVILLVLVLFIIAFVITQGFERLAEANRMKSEFVSIVSHQLRSPLTNLRWAADFLISSDKEKLKEKEADYLKIMKENAVRMGELIDNLLIVSRIEQGRFPLKKEEVNLEDMIKEVIKDFEIFAEASNVKINIAIVEGLPPIFIDKFQIRLLLDNLLSNAMRYTKGGGKIEISLSRDNKNILFKIKDSGVGIPQRDQKYIFQKFFRAQNAQTYQTQGSGLGLYIAKCVAESSGGKISFKSEEGKGSTFWFTIPIK